MKQIKEELEKYFVEHSLETECDSGGTHIEHIVHRFKVWATECVGEDSEDPHPIKVDMRTWESRNNLRSEIKKRIDESAK